MINRLNKMLTFFVIIETFVIVSLMQKIDEKSLFNIILYLFIFTFFAFGITYVLYTIHFEYSLIDLKRLSDNVFIFNSETNLVKLLTLFLSVFLYVLSIVYDINFIALALLILCGSFTPTTRIFFIERDEVFFTDNYLTKPIKVRNVNFNEKKKVINVLFMNGKQSIFKIKQKQLNQVKDIVKLVSK